MAKRLAFRESKKPQVHALVIGINDFANKELALRYAVADARAVASALEEQAGSFF